MRWNYLFCFSLLASSVVQAEEPDLREIAVDSVKDYVIENPGGGGSKYVMAEQPIIRFTTLGIDEADIFLWTRDGRPALAGQVFRLKNVEGGLWLHEFQSLSGGPFTLRLGDKELWTPKTEGVKWHTLESDMLPSDSPRIRLTQFKFLARDFTGVEQTPGVGGGSELKNFGLTLKPKEAYRYQSKTDDVLDGVVFWFTQEENTDPELLLLIEAVQSGQTKSWRYTLGRLTCWPMQIDHKGVRIADLPNMLEKSKKTDAYHIWRPAIP